MPLTMPELHLLPTLPPEGGRIGPTRWDWMLLVTFAGQFGFWVLFTDQPGRFMLPAVIVLGLLVGRSMEAMPPTTGAIFTFFKDLAGETVARVLAFVSSWRSFAAVLMLILALVSGLQLLRRLEVDTGDFIPAEVREGQSPLWSAGQLFRYDFTTAEQTPEGLLNRWLADHDAPQDRAVLWLVGDATPFNILYPVHYNVVFSHDELADQLANRPPAEVANWLGAHGFRYVYVNWQEAARLRGTYGFPKSITRASIQGLGRVTILKELSPIPMALLPDAAVRSEDYEPPWIIDLGAASTTQPAGAR